MKVTRSSRTWNALDSLVNYLTVIGCHWGSTKPIREIEIIRRILEEKILADILVPFVRLKIDFDVRFFAIRYEKF